jgi:hypothetical protein
MPIVSYPERTEQNVIDSDGTVIISHGRLTAGSANTKDMAEKHKHPWLHLDMAEVSVDEGAQKLREWITEHRIAVLNVAEPRHSRDSRIYSVTIEVLRAAFA